MSSVRPFVIFLLTVGLSVACTRSSASDSAQESATSSEESSAFWRAVKMLSFDDPAIREAEGEEKEYALALQSVVQGREGAEDAMRRLCDAADAKVREAARRLYTELLAAESRWAEIDLPESDSPSDLANDGRALSAEYRKLQPEILDFPDGPVMLPAKRARFTGTPLIPVTVNGHRRWFLVDTGARLTILASDVARAAGVTPLGDESARAGTATTRTVSARPAVIHDLDLGGVRFRNHPSVIIRKEDLRFKLFGLITLLKIDGILGWNALSRMDVEIDYKKPQVVLRRPIRSETASRNLFWLGEPLVRGIGPDGVGLVFSLDTGGRRSFALPELLRKTEARIEGVHVKRVGGAGGSERVPMRKIAPIEAHVSDCTVRLSEVREEWRSDRLVLPDGFVGVDLADRGWMRLDPTNGRLECRPQPPVDGIDAALETRGIVPSP